MSDINFKDLTRRKFMKTMLLAGTAAAIDWSGLGALAGTVPDKKSFPVVVIGAGLGGLVSAAYLAKYGFPVTLIEQHNIPGGYATSFERMQGKYNFEVSLHATVAENAMPQKILSDIGVWDKLNVVNVPEVGRLITKEHDLILPSRDPEGYKKVLADAFPEEKKGIYAFVSDMEQVQKELWEGTQFKESMMEKLEKTTLEDWMSMHIKSHRVKEYLSMLCGYYGLPPSKLNALFFAIATGEYIVTGGQYYKARSQDLSNTLMDAVIDMNGEVLLETEVSKIVLNEPGNKAGSSKKSEIKGVRDTEGNFYPARAVIANANVPVVFDKMIPKERRPQSYLKKLEKYTPSLSSFVVWLGLKEEIKNVDGYEIFMNDGRDINAGYEMYNKSDLSKSDIGVTIYDNLYKGYSSSGTTTITIMTLADYGPWKKYEKDYFSGNKSAYKKEKERIADAFIKRVEERVIPGLRNMIEVKEIGTPLTNVRYTKNPNGAIYGYDRDLEHLNATTPVKGLYLASAWSHGGGYTPCMMAGRQATETLLEDVKRGL